MSEKELIKKDLEEVAKKQRKEELQNLEHYHYLKENGYILFETITGSQAHGTNTETSDIDKAFVYILPKDDIYGIKYKEQLKIHKDFMGYEIRRFLELLRKANPTVLELLFSPDDCHLIKHPVFQYLIDVRDTFITKECDNAFRGYAKQQREKAEGLNKLQNWEGQRVTKKTPIDFCKVPVGYNSIPVTKYLEDKGKEQMFAALSAVNNCRDLYALFYDKNAELSFSEKYSEGQREGFKATRKAAGLSMGLGYKGIAFEDSDDIRLSNIPFEERVDGFLCHVSYNKDGYMKHCKEYTRYQKWLIDRNEARWVENTTHGQRYDGKNLMHFMRLIYIGKEIAQGKGITIRRPDAQELLKIRRGEVSLQEIFEKSDELLNEMKTLFQNSNLPDGVDSEFIHQLLVKIRTDYYHARKSGYSYEILNTESENTFFKKYYGDYSELQTLFRAEIAKTIKEEYNGDANEFFDNYDMSWLNVIPQDMWPEEDGERLDTENVRIVKVTRDKVTIVVGGDWQKGAQFDIVVWADGAAVINVHRNFDNGSIRYEEFMKQLGYEQTEDRNDN
jgi:predicted nucleotidyltransferase